MSYLTLGSTDIKKLMIDGAGGYTGRMTAAR